MKATFDSGRRGFQSDERIRSSKNGERGYSSILQFRSALFVLLGVLSSAQILILSDVNNLLCVAIVAGGMLFCANLAIRVDRFQRAPLSSLAVLAFSSTNLFIPLLGTTLELNPLIFNLRMPLETFGFTAAAAAILQIAHEFYLRFPGGVQGSGRVARLAFQPLGLFIAPTVSQLWVMGGLGLAALAAGGFGFSTETIDTSRILPQIVNSFRPLAAAPLMIPILPFFYSSLRPRPWSLGIVAYGVVLVVVAMGIGGRGAIAIPVASVATAVGLAILTGRLRVNLFKPRVIVCVGAVLFIAMPLAGYISTSMKLSRRSQMGMSGAERIGKTLSTMTDFGRVTGENNFDGEEVLTVEIWDERYLKNEFFQRSSLVPFTDNSFYFSRNFGDADRARLNDFAWSRFLTILPSPLIQILGMKFNKWSALSVTFGDYIYYSRARFDYSALRAGSVVAIGWAQFHWNSIWIWFISGLVVFFILDSFAMRQGAFGQSHLMISPAMLLGLYVVAMCFNQDALPSLAVFFFRVLPQQVIIYLLVFLSTRLLLGQRHAFLTKRPAVARRKSRPRPTGSGAAVSSVRRKRL